MLRGRMAARLKVEKLRQERDESRRALAMQRAELGRQQRLGGGCGVHGFKFSGVRSCNRGLS